MTRLTLDPEVEPLLAPLRGLLDAALARLPEAGAIAVGLGPAWSIDDAPGGARVVLPAALTGPDVVAPGERPGPYALDRWRRAVACVLEGLALRSLGVRGPPTADWRPLAVARHEADAACPDLALALPDLVAAPAGGGPGADPGVGVAVAAAIAAGGGDPRAEIGAWIAGDGPTPERWLALARWVLGAGLAARVGVPLDAAPAQDIPLELPAWSWARLDVPAHPRGGRVACSGGAAVAAPWAVGGERLRTVAAAAAPGRLLADVGFPVGAWEAASARGFGQVFGIRGMTWNFKPDGRVELVLADAFAGSFDAVEMAEQVGTSGVVPGRWRVAGPARVALAGLDTTGIAMHGRGDQPFAVPAMGLGLGQVLQAMTDGDWTWEQVAGELYLRGAVMGGSVEMRLRRG